MTDMQKSWGLHLGIIALLFVLQFILPAYHHGSLARIMVLTCYAMGYNILFGYTGLLSLGHALFFAAGRVFSLNANNAIVFLILTGNIKCFESLWLVVFNRNYNGLRPNKVSKNV